MQYLVSYIVLHIMTYSHCGSSPIPGVQDKIASLRYRHKAISESIAQLESCVAANSAKLEEMRHLSQENNNDRDHDYVGGGISQPEILEVTDEQIEQELAEIRELDRRKQALEDRVTSMERDLGGLMS